MIHGKVIQITKAESCNIAVAHLDEKSPLLYNHEHPIERDNVIGHTQIGYGVAVIPSVDLAADNQHHQPNAGEKVTFNESVRMATPLKWKSKWTEL